MLKQEIIELEKDTQKSGKKVEFNISFLFFNYKEVRNVLNELFSIVVKLTKSNAGVWFGDRKPCICRINIIIEKEEDYDTER